MARRCWKSEPSMRPEAHESIAALVAVLEVIGIFVRLCRGLGEIIEIHLRRRSGRLVFRQLGGETDAVKVAFDRIEVGDGFLAPDMKSRGLVVLRYTKTDVFYTHY